jgi:zinc protease
MIPRCPTPIPPVPRTRPANSAAPVGYTRGNGRRAPAVVAVLATVTLAAIGGNALVDAQRPADRSAPPPLGPVKSLALPPVVKRALSNGLPVWIVESHEAPLVQVSLLVHAGSGDDPAGRLGVASLTAAMLDEGAGTRTALEIADEVEFLGANLSTTSTFDASAVRLNVPVARIAAALPVMADVALRPLFPEGELNRLRQERLTALLQSRDDAAAVAPLAFARTVFGSAHRYGSGASGTETTLKAISAPQLKEFHAAMYRPGNATLIVVGDVTPRTMLPQLEKLFGEWRAAGPVRRIPVPAAPQLDARAVSIVDMPAAEQSQIRIGWVGVSRATPDYFALEVLNTVLGGSFTSRLNQNLRETHGYSYGASSRFDMRLSAGAFQAGAGVQTDKTSEAIGEFFNELNGILKPIGADELAKAKNYIALGFPSGFETIGDLAAHLEEMAVYKLPDDYFATYIANVQAVTAEAVAKVAARYIDPQKLAIVVVGDRKTIEPGIRALNLGPVRITSVEEAVQ